MKGLRKVATEVALMSDKGNLLMRTTLQVGCASHTKYAWFTNANKRSDCQFLKDSDESEWDYLVEKGLYLCDIAQDEEQDCSAPEFEYAIHA